MPLLGLMNRTISLPLEVDTLLKTERNASELITALLLKYYGTQGVNASDLKNLRAKLDEQAQKDKTELEKKKAEIDAHIKQAEQFEKNREYNYVDSTKLIEREFKKYAGRDITAEEFQEFRAIADLDQHKKPEQRMAINEFARLKR